MEDKAVKENFVGNVYETKRRLGAKAWAEEGKKAA